MKRFIIGFIATLLVISFCIWQNNDIAVTRFIYETEKVNDNLNGYKIAQISDLHNKEFGQNQEGLLNILLKEDPDIIVITGDIVDSNNTNVLIALQFVQFVQDAVKIAPVYYVTGNHEYMLDKEKWDMLIEGMEQSGVTLLDNRAIILENQNRRGFYLVGLGDRNLSDNVLKALCSYMDSDMLQILLAHEPQYFDNYRDAGVDLVLTGHAHGGQFRLPFIGGLVAPNQGLFPKYTSGAYLEDNTTMIVSRGLGNSIIPIRVFNRPEIIIIELRQL